MKITPSEPSPAYKDLQRQAYDREGSEQITLQLQRLFELNFDLTPIDTQRSAKLKQVLSSLLKNNLIDHVRTYRDAAYSSCILVTQPYCSEEEFESREELLNAFHVSLVDLNAWNFYYPGNCCCYGLVLSSAAQEVLLAVELQGGNLSTSDGHARMVFEEAEIRPASQR